MDESPRQVLVVAGPSAGVLTLPAYLRVIRAERNCRLTVVMSSVAVRFLPPEALDSEADEVFDEQSEPPPPASVFAGLDGVIVLPATAAVLAEVAGAAQASWITAGLRSTTAPVVFVPSMNPGQWNARSTRMNIERLRAGGLIVVEPERTTTTDGGSGSTEVRSMPGPPAIALILRLLLWPDTGFGPLQGTPTPH
ncbi:flavoprotein [Kribbella sp. NPDC056861]|uniref:flavoprotein n=1 Tax=Kribbella sp. NPDC056861 TaxID=3154857 RepID=UPI00342A62BF